MVQSASLTVTKQEVFVVDVDLVEGIQAIWYV